MAEETMETPRTSRDLYVSHVPSRSGTDPRPLPQEQREQRVDKEDVPCMTPGDKAMDVQGKTLSDCAVVEQHSCTFNELAIDMIQTMECEVEGTELVSISAYKPGANIMGLDHEATATLSMDLDKQLGSQPLSTQSPVQSWKRRAR
ncbi:hypothetical protein FCV25MIE_08509 [Fagus crenata]